MVNNMTQRKALDLCNKKNNMVQYKTKITRSHQTLGWNSHYAFLIIRKGDLIGEIGGYLEEE